MMKNQKKDLVGNNDILHPWSTSPFPAGVFVTIDEPSGLGSRQ